MQIRLDVSAGKDRVELIVSNDGIGIEANNLPDGGITAHSGGKDRRSTFVVRLPICALTETAAANNQHSVLAGCHRVLIAAGIKLYEAIKAHDLLTKDGITARVLDLYSIKPLDHATGRKAADETKVIFTIEDYFPAGGLGEAVRTSLSDHASVQ